MTDLLSGCSIKLNNNLLPKGEFIIQFGIKHGCATLDEGDAPSFPHKRLCFLLIVKIASRHNQLINRNVYNTNRDNTASKQFLQSAENKDVYEETKVHRLHQALRIHV